MFDGKNSKRIDFLESEREKIWARLVELEGEVSKKPSDYEKEAKQASKKTAEFRNKAEERLNSANELLNAIEQIHTKTATESEHIRAIKDKLDNIVEKSVLASEEILERSNSLQINLEKIQKIFTDHPNLRSEISELDDLITTLEEDASKANTTYKGILTKKAEIDELYREIIGYEDENEEGEIVEIEGLKSELESTYSELSEKAKELNQKITEIRNQGEIAVNSFIEANESRMKESIDKSDSEYEEITNKIASLLPDALTAGLSSAFIAKKKEEEKVYEEYKRKFNRGILYLVIVSLLPIAISIFFLATDVPLSEVIERSPKIILAFLPIYIPLVWSTISANKKVNLSKRLIEEYSHKQVLSMTVEGLSNQIDNIEDDSISRELRIKLLYNFLYVSSENPGKLISNYERSDNPIFDYLERRRTNSKEIKEDKSLTKTLEERSTSILNKAMDELEDGVVGTVKNNISS